MDISLFRLACIGCGEQRDCYSHRNGQVTICQTPAPIRELSAPYNAGSEDCKGFIRVVRAGLIDIALFPTKASQFQTNIQALR